MKSPSSFSVLSSLIFVLFLRLASSSNSNPLISYYYKNYTWVLSPSSMNHYSACHGLKLEPTTLSDIIPWNYNIMKDIVEGLQLSIVNNSHGLRGCCVPSLWCSNTECYTQSLQSNYVNYHSTHPIDLNTVYTCRVGSLSKSITVEKGSLQNGVIVISGNNFGNKENNIDSVIGTSPITNIESCNTVCQSCESSPCAKDNACVLVDSTYSCLMFCNGPGDTSCPCGTVCQHVNVYTSQSSYVTTHFCAPKGLECDNYLASTINQFQGLSPRIYNWVNDTDIPSSKSNIFDVTVSVPEYNTGDLPVEIDMQSCTTHSQCFDGSPFTEETCQDGKCFFKQLSQIGSTLPMIRERSRSFSYVMFATENMETDQAMFESRVRLDGVLLNSVSDADDLPQEYFSLGFSFLYFGNKVSNIAINPNGLVSFPPYPYCHALAGTLYCPVYGTGTNTIAIWGSDWDLRVGGDSSTVHILNQTQDNDNFQTVYGINANALHILYSSVHKYVQGGSRSSQSDPSTFSLSVYSDSSIRIRYHSLLSKQLASDVFGLWGSRVSNHDSQGSKYHEEMINHELIHSGHDVTFCYISTIVCSSKAVAISGSTVNLTLLGNIPSCLALGENLVIKCVWLGHGSSYETGATFYSTKESVILSCPVPNLELENDSLVSLDLSYEASKSSLISSLENADKSLITKLIDHQSGQLSTAHVMFRYFQSDQINPSYGCNPLLASSDTCDLCGVCGGNNSFVDCHGDCFGSAYIDNCGICAGGATGIYPDSTCDLYDPVSTWENGDVLDTLSKTILLLTMMICMTFIFSACMRIIRASFVGPEEDRQDGFFGLGLTPMAHRPENGLSNFEIDALGQIIFAKDTKGILNGAGSDIESSPSSCVMTIPLQQNLECSICLIEFNEDDRCRQLPCDHIFHTQCIDQWFTVSVLCPMCKRNIRAILHGEDDIGQRSPGTSLQQQQSSTNQTVPEDYFAAVSPMATSIEMIELSSNSSSSTSSTTTRTQSEQEGESVALIPQNL